VLLYQALCFRAWGLAPVRRRAYFAIDRHKLSYPNALEGLNCLYCSYANGVIGYVREVAADRAVLVSDPAPPPHPSSPRALFRLCGVWRRGRFSDATGIASRGAQEVN